MEIDDRSFRKALGCFASGVTVVSGRDEQGALIGVTVSAFSSVSLNPPLVLFCLDKRNKSLESFRDAPFAINVLREDQRQVSIQFASKGDDKWKGIEHTLNADGVPLIDNSLAHLECAPHQVVDGGDHLIVIGRVVRLKQQAGGQPLVYFRGAYANLGESC
jgi:flavin reductase (DIM6/NTAB) family NADH-FMN oxidoreductase RutF